MTPKQKAAIFRRVARGADRILRIVVRDHLQGDEEYSAEREVGQDYFTCNAVGSAEIPPYGDKGGGQLRYAYGSAFFADVDQSYLWNLPIVERNEVRVLMLLFAAAMAETGDL